MAPSRLFIPVLVLAYIPKGKNLLFNKLGGLFLWHVYLRVFITTKPISLDQDRLDRHGILVAPYYSVSIYTLMVFFRVAHLATEKTIMNAFRFKP